MVSFVLFLLFVGIVLWAAYRKVGLATTTLFLAAVLAAYTITGSAPVWWKVLLWLAFAPLALLNVTPLRIRFLTRPFLRVYKRMLPSMSSTEREALEAGEATLVDMRTIDEVGIRKPLADFLAVVEAANGMLHVSLDVDFLDPSIAPAVGTTVPGGATVREGHLVMEMLCDSGLVTSLDLVELNPFLDDRGKTASLMVDLTASLLGRRIFDRPTRSHS